jgi:hypothetical protein
VIGMRVEFPINAGEWGTGTVSSFDEDTGLIAVRDDDGELWKGYEYQVVTERSGRKDVPEPAEEARNICEKCLAMMGIQEPSDLLYETGLCDVCGGEESGFGEVVDLGLLDLYAGLGFTPEFVHSHLPRLRRYHDKTLTLVDIGREIARHGVFGTCRTDLPCSGYSDRPWRFDGKRTGEKL